MDGVAHGGVCSEGGSRLIIEAEPGEAVDDGPVAFQRWGSVVDQQEPVATIVPGHAPGDSAARLPADMPLHPQARVTEAATFLGAIKQRQESYRSEFGQYCAVDGDDWGTYNPSTIPGIDPVAWTTTTEWQQLGAAPDGPTRFQYATVAGVPGETAPANTNLDEDDHWFAARAQGDLDEDTVTFFLEIYSQSSHIYNSAAAIGGWE